MSKNVFPDSQLPIRRSVELLPTVFQTDSNAKFLGAVLDPLIQPGTLQKTVGYVGRRFGKTYNGKDIYLDSDQTLRSRYQLEPGVVIRKNSTIEKFYDYIDLKNQIKFFNNNVEKDNLITESDHYSWNPPIDWDKFINYREYYWVPSGPPSLKILGQSQNIVSTYKVKQGLGENWVFTPDGLTNNPTIALYRGQTYNFNVSLPGEGFSIRTNYDTGSLIYNPTLSYNANQLAVYDGKLWKAKTFISPADGSSITFESQDWEYIEDVSNDSIFDYNDGVTNNNTEIGTVTFTVPLNAPDVLFYQSTVHPNRFGRFIISNADTATKINVTKEIIGKKTYKSSNGIEFSNGMVVEFIGQVVPEKYSRDTWLVEGVGSAITLTKFTDLIVPVLSTKVPEVLFDNSGFDADPFDDASEYPGDKDYITINRSSPDLNPWSRYNRWFHRSVLDYSHKANGSDFDSVETFRAKRPIIEFHAGLQLINHGKIAKQTVDYIDTFTDDIFSKIEGSKGYNIDGEDLFEGARILVIADKDSLANNKIYKVEFIQHPDPLTGQRRKQISLRETEDTISNFGESILVSRGTENKGKMFFYNGTAWKSCQDKISVQQAPLFDIFNENEESLSDQTVYETSSFTGSKILSYAAGNGPTDTELGFSISYLNINNVGDIEFDFNWDLENFSYYIQREKFTKNINTGFLRNNVTGEYHNCWIKTDKDILQPIIDSKVVEENSNNITFNTVNWSDLDTKNYKIIFYINGKKVSKDKVNTSSGISNNGKFVFVDTLNQNDVVSLKLYSNIVPEEGYYEIPIGLEKNPLNQDLKKFTLGQAVDHLSTAIEVDERVVGDYPGANNLRDLNDFQNKARRFVKHSGIAPLSIALLCDKKLNLIKSIEYCQQSYSEFKNKFIEFISDNVYNDDPAEFVDQIISDMGRTKTSNSPFVESDMIGSGAYTEIRYTVDDPGIKTYTLSTPFDLETASRKAVYVYINGQQKVVEKDYYFNKSFSFVTIKVDLQENDLIQIREYNSTSYNFVPATPTSLGLYKKYLPRKFLDNTYVDPVYVIQGHDGSITRAYNDYRDDVILELELRIYNNIKVRYDTSLFDIDLAFSSYYGGGVFTKDELDPLLIQDFLKWVSGTNIDYTNNNYFDSENSFTYTYSNMADKQGKQSLPGYWRGVYNWFYDSYRPHVCPWELLGFTEQPDWWESQYGAAPYTNGNLLLWEDLENGVIRQGTRQGIYDRYKRPGLTKQIPVDNNGNLLSPLDSSLASNFALINNQGPFVLGDVGPVEYAWRSSPEFPFSVVKALCLLRPFEYINTSLDFTRVKKNKIDQYVHSSTDTFIKLENVVVPTVGEDQAYGLISILMDYVRSLALTDSALQEIINNIDVNLSTRLSGFVDKAQQKYLLDSKSPSSTSSSIFIPQENYEIIFNTSTPIFTLSYSGVLVEKVNRGWKITGYDNQFPYFNYYEALNSNNDPTLSVGGVSEDVLRWEQEKFYGNGVCISYQNNFYRSIKSFRSGLDFSNENLKQIAGPATVGSITALYRRNFNRLRKKTLTYGTILPTIQAVVDFLFGYGEFLKSIGFVFDAYDKENKTAQDWVTSSKEFMFWTKHNWEEGAILSLSPSAAKIDINLDLGVADSLFDSFYPYQILRADGKVLQPSFIDIKRDFQNITVSTNNTTDGIYFLKAYFVLKEHVTIFSDRTVFNDVIYDKPTGYRQERIKSRGFRTIDWDGDYTSPGFLFDNVNIESWQPFVDYRLGDIVAYKSFNWTSKENQRGSELFDDSKWTKLDSTPQKQLVSNFDYRINLFEDYYNLDGEGLGTAQRELGRHSIGYQSRNYLQNIAEDEITQFQLYQGFIREKGTANSITKIFDKLSKTDEDSIELYEEWAIRTGRFGGINELLETEIRINKINFELNPQPILIVDEQISDVKIDQKYRINSNDIIKSVDGVFTTNINPTKYYELNSRISGYVRSDQVDFIVKDKTEILDLDINLVKENNYIWITYDNQSWNVLRFENQPLLIIESVTELIDLEVEIRFNRVHEIQENDIVGLRNIIDLEGFFFVKSTTARTIIVEKREDADAPAIDDSAIQTINLLVPARIDSYNTLDLAEVAALKKDTKLWIDSDQNNRWEVIQKQKSYSYKNLIEYGVQEPVGSGTSVLYINSLKQIISSMPSTGYLYSYVETGRGLELYQVIPPPSEFRSQLSRVFGSAVAATPDGQFLIVGSPNASYIKSKFMGEFDPRADYFASEIVIYNGKLWKAVNDVPGNPSAPTIEQIKNGEVPVDSSYIDIYSVDWEPVTIVEANSTGRLPGYNNQGMVTIYKFESNRWVEFISIVSPRPSADELFGSAISVGQNGDKYYLAVSAPGALESRGRVYLYLYDNDTVQEVDSASVVTGGSGYSVYEVADVEIISSGSNYNTDSAGLVLTINYLGQTATFTATVDTETTVPGENDLLFPIKTVTPLDRGLWNVLPTAPLIAVSEPTFSSDGSTLSGGCVLRLTFREVNVGSSVLTVNYEGQIATFSAAISAGEVISVEPIVRGRFTTIRTAPVATSVEPSYGSGATLSIVYREKITKGWRHLEDSNYSGIFNPFGGYNPYTGSFDTSAAVRFYPAGSVIWWDNKLWKALVDTNLSDDGSSFYLGLSDWIELDPISTQCSLPTNVALGDDGSTLAAGLLDKNQIAELVKAGDLFGSSLAMNKDGSILVVGSPNSDGQFFVNYRGVWSQFQEYTESDVVQYDGNYYRLMDTSTPGPVDSSIVSKGDVPVPGITELTLSDSTPWLPVGNLSTVSSGKIHIYKKDSNDVYNLIQVVTSENIDSYNNTDSGLDIGIYSGDKFGFSLDLDQTGSTLVVSSPDADTNLQNQGSVYVFTTTDLDSPIYNLEQKISSYESYNNEQFGFSVSVDYNSEKIVVGAKNAPYKIPVRFDISAGTTFDGNATSFSEPQGYTGQVYVFEKKSNIYLLAEKLEADLQNAESFGYSIDTFGSVIVTGSPNYRAPLETEGQALSSHPIGITRLFKKDSNVNSWNTLAQQTQKVDIDLITSIEVYDEVTNIKLADVDIIDHAKLKILGIAEQEISYKTVYDPAVYTNGTDEQVVDETTAWFEKNVGKLWWNLSTVKWIDYEQGDDVYRSGNWNGLAFGSSIDIYEWVESSLLPSDWSILADTNEGLAEGISGQPLYSDNTVYSVKEIYNVNTGQLTGTRYYFWVKNKAILPTNTVGRRLPSSDVASLIINPASSGLPIIALLDSNKFLAYNFNSLLENDTAYLNIQYKKNKKSNNLSHNEYLLLSENLIGSIPNQDIETKWIDSLVGFDQAGNSVPDPKIPEKQRYGISFRPRQGMFEDNNKILGILIDRINEHLLLRPFADTLNYENLNLVDPKPEQSSNEFDDEVDNFIDLQNINTVRLKQAVLTVNIVDAEIDTIDIVDPGFGYKIPPPIEIEGDGSGAKAELIIDNQGRVSSVTVIAKGKKYTSAIAKVRSYAVLVNVDETANDFWSVYSYDTVRKDFFRSKSQGFDTTKYWLKIDWYATGYSKTSRISKEVGSLYEESSLAIQEGDLLKVKEFGSGGWALLNKVKEGAGDVLNNYELVGRQNGTIQLSTKLYSKSSQILGFDATSSYDTSEYDLLPSLELRNILNAVKQDIFIEDLRNEWNNLFLISLRYAFSEQEYIDWAFKTSFLNATHNVGSLEQKINYKNDNLDSFRSYVEEVKPYRTTIRQYKSRYTGLEITNSVISDFDLPPVYSSASGKILPINSSFDLTDQYPWKNWKDNLGFEIKEILVSNSGDGYTSAPTVLIEGDGSGAEAIAFITNKKLRSIKLISGGTGYTKAPTVSLVGGNGFNSNVAKAVAILGESPIRTFDVKLKFDRISKTGTLSEFNFSQSFTASASSAVFDLKYAPSKDRSKISVTRNEQIVFNNEYEIIYYTSTVDTYSLTKAKIKFLIQLEQGDLITVAYEKFNEIYDSVDRINSYYNPVEGMKGKVVSQLMTGIDYGGIQIQGTTFDVSGGWDALPWFTDAWDSVESNNDYHYVVSSADDGSTITVLLPKAPAANQRVSIYLKRAGSKELRTIETLDANGNPVVVYDEAVAEPPVIRIDDPYFGMYDGSTVMPNGRTTAPENALMPTFVGDGENRTVVFDEYGVQTFPGDTLIFRNFESDGTVSIKDPNLLDTELSGGSFAGTWSNNLIGPNAVAGSYTTAQGTLAQDISIDGGKLISPDQVPAPEENIPGQVLESLSIKVFNSTFSGGSPVNLRLYFADGIQKNYDIGLHILEGKSLVVYIDKIKQEFVEGSNLIYTINYSTNQVEFVDTPVAGSLIEIISIGVGGVSILDYTEFVTDGETSHFLTKANYSDTQSVLVTVDGIEVDIGFVESSTVTETTGKTLIEFGTQPERNQVVKIVVLGASLDTDSTQQSIIRSNQQTFIYDGSTRKYDLDKFVNLTRNSSKSAMLVEVNNAHLQGVDAVVQVYDGTNNTVALGIDPIEVSGTITSNNIKVFVNNVEQSFLVVWTYNGTTSIVTVSTTYLQVGDIIKVENDVRSQYNIVSNDILISDLVDLTAGDLITVTWFSEYPTFDIVSDEYTGGKSIYRLSSTPINSSYVWVYKNGIRLTGNKDYSVSLPRSVLYLNDETTSSDKIKIFQFGNRIYKKSSAYQIFKDMLNVYHYKRYSIDRNVKLAQDLNYYDQVIKVTDASNLSIPITSRNIPGIIEINGEKIEYLVLSGNTLSQLRRGSFGTAIATVHEQGSHIVNLGSSENIPYVEEQDKNNFISDGSTLLVGPLPYVPNKSTRNSWYRTDIPSEYGPCDQIEVFVGGVRLRKDHITIYKEELGPSSPLADTTLQAEFSVDGDSNYVRLSEPVKAGTRITIVRRTGRSWYERGETTATSGLSLLDNNTPIAVFLSQKTTELPE